MINEFLNKSNFNGLDSHAKKKCQVFTPIDLVESMLDLAGYKDDVIGKRILENSFGSGTFLVAIADRHIKCALRQKMTPEEIRRDLERSIVGYEIDEDLARTARKRLDELAAKHGITQVSWDLRIEDYLCSDCKERFSYVVGNPPYLVYKEIDPAYRTWIRESFKSCKSGKFDYCYAFVEHASHQLEDGGVLVQLIPGSLFKNVFARTLREMLKPGITTIVDFANENVFGDALVSPCVFRFAQGAGSSVLSYQQRSTGTASTLEKAGLKDKWTFSQADETGTLTRFGDLFDASMPVATLSNDAFLLDEHSDVENDLIKDAFSPRTSKGGKGKRILFPYSIDDNGSIGRYSSDEFRERFPKAAEHLRSFKPSLEARKADPSAAWFEYGRSQGLRHVPEKKLLISTVVTNDVTAYELEKNTVAFAGIVITAAKEDADLRRAKAVLESDSFFEYARNIGTSVSGKSVRITCRDVAEFRFPQEQVLR